MLQFQAMFWKMTPKMREAVIKAYLYNTSRYLARAVDPPSFNEYLDTQSLTAQWPTDQGDVQFLRSCGIAGEL